MNSTLLKYNLTNTCLCLTSTVVKTQNISVPLLYAPLQSLLPLASDNH